MDLRRTPRNSIAKWYQHFDMPMWWLIKDGRNIARMKLKSYKDDYTSLSNGISSYL
jgi:hypothetical protein